MYKRCFAFLFIAMSTFTSKAVELDSLASLLMEPEPAIAQQKIYSTELVYFAYQAKAYQYIWQNKVSINQAINALNDAWQEGLQPQDYHLSQLNFMRANIDSYINTLEFDVLLTDAVMTYATHLIRGRTNPNLLTASWNYELYAVSPQKAAELLLNHIKNESVTLGLEQLKPKVPQYALLKKKLAFYTELASEKQVIIRLEKKLLRPGEKDTAVKNIRTHLQQLSYLPNEAVNSPDNIYSAELVAAIKQLQTFNQLPADGVIGKDTLQVLNTSAAQRVDTLKVNLERIRWVENSLSDSFLIVNIAGYELYLYQQGKLSWKSNVVVGKNYTKTPVFKGKMSYIVVNPTWTVPRSIARGMLAKIKKDPNYLTEKNFMVVDSRRNLVDEQQIDWSSLSRNNLPYWFVQRASASNALGQIKFMLPNKYAIYLHDTPAKALFGRDQRAFSHGCVRVDQPFKLAEHILSDDQTWSAQSLQATVDTAQTTRVNLKKPLDVLLMYWTAAQNSDGFHFYPDIYKRDQAVLNALRQPL
ncbi:murein L,D-transpeptidase [Colwelliaceae bacterium MEBiC 14330]